MAIRGGAPGAVIRDGDWKLIEWFDDGRLELFNLGADPGETTNLATREPERVAAFSGRLHEWQRDVGAIGRFRGSFSRCSTATRHAATFPGFWART
jgi:hypothetical protein